MKSFEFHEPGTLKEVISFLVRYGEEGRLLAGGTDLLVRMKRRQVAPAHIINLKKISELNFITYHDETGLSIGAATPLSLLASSEVVRDRYPVLVDSISKIGSPQIQNMATIGGNLCNASPSADTAPPLIALNSHVKIVGPRGERQIALEELFMGPGMTVLGRDEILAEIRVPKMPVSTSAVYLKHGIRRAMEIAIVGVAVALDLDHQTLLCNQARVVMGAVAPTPVRSRGAEEVLRGHTVDEELIKKAAEAAALDARPISDLRSSGEYRLEMVKIMIERSLERIVAGDTQKVIAVGRRTSASLGRRT